MDFGGGPANLPPDQPLPAHAGRVLLDQTHREVPHAGAEDRRSLGRPKLNNDIASRTASSGAIAQREGCCRRGRGRTSPTAVVGAGPSGASCSSKAVVEPTPERARKAESLADAIEGQLEEPRELRDEVKV